MSSEDERDREMDEFMAGLKTKAAKLDKAAEKRQRARERKLMSISSKKQDISEDESISRATKKMFEMERKAALEKKTSQLSDHFKSYSREPSTKITDEDFRPDLGDDKLDRILLLYLKKVVLMVFKMSLFGSDL